MTKIINELIIAIKGAGEMATGLACRLFQPDDIQTAWDSNSIPVIVDPGWESIKAIRPHVVIDAIIAKKNLGTNLSEAPLVIGLGPGFNEADRVARAYLNNGNFHDPIASSDPDFCISKFNIPQNNIFQ